MCDSNRYRTTCLIWQVGLYSLETGDLGVLEDRSNDLGTLWLQVIFGEAAEYKQNIRGVTTPAIAPHA